MTINLNPPSAPKACEPWCSALIKHRPTDAMDRWMPIALARCRGNRILAEDVVQNAVVSALTMPADHTCVPPAMLISRRAADEFRRRKRAHDLSASLPDIDRLPSSSKTDEPGDRPCARLCVQVAKRTRRRLNGYVAWAAHRTGESIESVAARVGRGENSMGETISAVQHGPIVLGIVLYLRFADSDDVIQKPLLLEQVNGYLVLDGHKTLSSRRFDRTVRVLKAARLINEYEPNLIGVHREFVEEVCPTFDNLLNDVT